MFKKITCGLALAILVFSFSACSQPEGDQTVPSGKEPTYSGIQAPDNGLTYVSQHLARFGTKDGLYCFKSTYGADDGDGYENLMYIDYATQKQVFLCNKSNCTHSDAGCTSYMDATGAEGLFVYNGKLYRLSGAGSRDGRIVPGLFVSDLDGANQKMIYSLDTGMLWDRDFVFGNGYLYADMMVYEEAESQNGIGFSVASSANTRLLSIDLKSGKAEIICNLGDRTMVGVVGNSIIIAQTQGNERVFSAFDVTTKAVQETGRIPYTDGYALQDGKIYYVPEGETTLCVLDLLTGETRAVTISLPTTANDISIHGGYAICTQWGVTGKPLLFAVDLNSGADSEINLYKSGLASGEYAVVEVVAEWNDYFLVSNGYKIDETYVDWVGVWQDYITEEYFALIKKTDFLTGNGAYLPIN